MFGFVCLQTGPRVFECVFEKSDSLTLKIRDGNNINHNVESSELFFDEYFCWKINVYIASWYYKLRWCCNTIINSFNNYLVNTASWVYFYLNKVLGSGQNRQNRHTPHQYIEATYYAKNGSIAHQAVAQNFEILSKYFVSI